MTMAVCSMDVFHPMIVAVAVGSVSIPGMMEVVSSVSIVAVVAIVAVYRCHVVCLFLRSVSLVVDRQRSFFIRRGRRQIANHADWLRSSRGQNI